VFWAGADLLQFCIKTQLLAITSYCRIGAKSTSALFMQMDSRLRGNDGFCAFFLHLEQISVY
jgi:hypothetical protein